jgi:hypothetical protein
VKRKSEFSAAPTCQPTDVSSFDRVVFATSLLVVYLCDESGVHRGATVIVLPVRAFGEMCRVNCRENSILRKFT